MTDMATLSPPKQMKTIITLLNLVRSELSIAFDHAERCLEMFISERQSNASIQQFTQTLEQIRGALTLIEISGATQLSDLMLEKTLSIPANADNTWDHTLSVLSTSLFTLRRYLENIENYPCSLPELLIPIINELRQTNKQPPLPDSYFIDIKVITPPLPHLLPESTDIELFGRLRQMYQIGLLGIIKNTNRDASLRMMSRSIDRLQKHLNNENAARLCWVTAAALESFTDSDMTSYPSRKKLFSRVDQQLRKTQIDQEPINEALLKDLLYIISLDNTLGNKALEVFGAFNLTPLSYNNKTLETEIANLAGPGQNAIYSFTTAIKEELDQTQTAINAFTYNTSNHKELIEALITNLKQLIKTLSVVNFPNAEILLKEQISILETHKQDNLLDIKILDRLADVILNVEDIITNYEATTHEHKRKIATASNSTEDNSNQYLKQGRQLSIQESLVGLGTAQQNIMAYIESNGDKQYLDKLPQILDEIYGCLLFLNQNRAADIIYHCKYYIDNNMVNSTILPATKELDNLADILASLEFFMETETLNRSVIDSKVLDLAEESLNALNIKNSANELDTKSHEMISEQTLPEDNTFALETTSYIESNNLSKEPNIETNTFDFGLQSIEPEELTEIKQEQLEPTEAISSTEPSETEHIATDEKDGENTTQAAQTVNDDLQFITPESWKVL